MDWKKWTNLLASTIIRFGFLGFLFMGTTVYSNIQPKNTSLLSLLIRMHYESVEITQNCKRKWKWKLMKKRALKKKKLTLNFQVDRDIHFNQIISNNLYFIPQYHTGQSKQQNNTTKLTEQWNTWTMKPSELTEMMRVTNLSPTPWVCWL